ncbi:DUF4214 domain-containing protein [Iamia sp. SCSIO 61187]|uniref:5'-nucleotidase C-terminal domain-containing protein n=1 Tax=Iamia sp. SCSIO 61187 TaxID=2722752 RepID=UPI001C6333BA|nr:5'-nucleotidase C-terminal domain-containing protein [Iamia sp. SCSIO 61187]QYG95065.1 DUF4214 domain-containing protein [Iamia sp. SCSIO 61187]
MPRPGRRAASALLLVCASLGALLIAPAPASAAPVQIQLLAINDFHGRLEADSFAGVPGVAKVATLIDEVSAEMSTSFAAAGDLIGASPFVSSVAGDEPTIDVLNLMGLDASSVGNHEFDKGYDDLVDRVDPLADYPYLGANVRFAAGGGRALDAYHVEAVGGVAVGYVGVVTEETPTLVSPDGISQLTFTDPVAEAEAVAADLKDGNDANGEADIVVVLTHEGAGPANIDSAAELAADPVFGEFVGMSADVDAIFSGHTHLPYAFEVPIPGTERTRPVLSAQEYGKKVGRVQLSVDVAAGTFETDLIELLDPTTYAEDPEVKAIVDEAKAESAELGAVQIGAIDADITRAPDRNVESDLANFIADALLAGTEEDNRGGADIAFINPGGIRDNFGYEAVDGRPGDADGVVTYAEAYAVQNFSNDVITLTYTGAEIEQILEQQWQPAGASRPLLWLGISEGLTYTYNPAAPRGYRINDGSVMLDGVPLDPAGEYRVTTNSFLAAGGDNFSAFTLGADPFTTGDTDLAVLRAYFESFLPDPVPVDREPRSFVAVPEQPDLTPFEAVAEAVGQQFEDFGRTPTDAEREAWEVGIYTGTRTLEQLILELETVELRSPVAEITRLYLGLFDRSPSDTDLDYWVGQLESGRTLTSVASFFGRSFEFNRLYGRDTTDEEFVTLLYANVLDREPDAEGLEFWLGELERGVKRSKVALLFTESPEFRTATSPYIRVIDLFVSMLGRAPAQDELDTAIAGIETGELTVTDLIAMILHSEEYAERVTPEPPA